MSLFAQRKDVPLILDNAKVSEYSFNPRMREMKAGCFGIATTELVADLIFGINNMDRFFERYSLSRSQMSIMFGPNYGEDLLIGSLKSKVAVALLNRLNGLNSRVRIF